MYFIFASLWQSIKCEGFAVLTAGWDLFMQIIELKAQDHTHLKGRSSHWRDGGFWVRKPKFVPQAPVRARCWVLDSVTGTGAEFLCIALPPIQGKLRFACLGVSEGTWCPVYKELWDLCSEGIKTCFQCTTIRGVVTAWPSPRLHRDSENLTLNKCHSRGNLKGKKLWERFITQTSKNSYCTCCAGVNTWPKSHWGPTCHLQPLKVLFSKFMEPLAVPKHILFSTHLEAIYRTYNATYCIHPQPSRPACNDRSQWQSVIRLPGMQEKVTPRSLHQQGQFFPLYLTA